MEKIVWGLLLPLVLLAACDGKKASELNSAIVKSSDTVTVASDSTAIEDETSPPKSADELFDDFIYSFTTSRKYQMKRISFPLRVLENGKESFIQSRTWKFNRLHLGQTSYTVLYENRGQMNLEKDTSLNKVLLEWIHLRQSVVRQYVFLRTNGEWRLTQINKMPLKEHPNYVFYRFYDRFSSDSIFQRSHVFEPVQFVTYDADNDFEPIEGVVDVDQWFAFKPILPEKIIYNINYGQTFQGQKRRFLVLRGDSNSLFSILEFKWLNNTWKLVKFEN